MPSGRVVPVAAYRQQPLRHGGAVVAGLGLAARVQEQAADCKVVAGGRQWSDTVSSVVRQVDVQASHVEENGRTCTSLKASENVDGGTWFRRAGKEPSAQRQACSRQTAARHGGASHKSLGRISCWWRWHACWIPKTLGLTGINAAVPGSIQDALELQPGQSSISHERTRQSVTWTWHRRKHACGTSKYTSSSTSSRRLVQDQRQDSMMRSMA